MSNQDAGGECSTWNEPGAPELLTVAEAAAFLGVSERTLRRLLALPANAARTRRETRRTATGARTITLLPAELIAELAACFENEQARQHPTANGGRNTGRTVAGTPAEHRQTQAGTPAGQDVPPFQPEQDGPQEAASEIRTPDAGPEEEQWQEHRQNGGANTGRTQAEGELPPFQGTALVPVYERLISEKDARIEDLQKALEAERAARLEAAQALSREQTLRAYALPAAATDDAGAPIATDERNTDNLREAELRALVRLQQARLDELEAQQQRRPWWAWWKGRA